MTTIPQTFDLMAMVEKGARDIGENLPPDGDWAPMLFFRNDKRVEIAPVEMEDKDKTALAIQIKLKIAQATEAVLVTSSWMVKREEKDIDWETLRPSEQPDRQEVLVFTHVTQDNAELLMASIERHPDAHPGLGPLSEHHEGLALSGRFADALRRGIG